MNDVDTLPMLDLTDDERLGLCAVTDWLESENGDIVRFKLLSKLNMETYMVEWVLFTQDADNFKQELTRDVCHQSEFRAQYDVIYSSLEKELRLDDLQFDLFSEDESKNLELRKNRRGNLTLISRIRHYLYRRNLRKQIT